MTIRHAASQIVRQWDIAVTDQTDNSDSVCTVVRDGEEIFRWHARDLQLTQPAEFRRQPLLPGFRQWASKTFEPEALEAAFILEGYFVSLARHFDMDQMAGEPALASKDGMGGACYRSPAIEHGVRSSGTSAIFPNPKQTLLKFL